MNNNNNKYDIIKRIPLGANGHIRVDCPFCGGSKTLSITDMDGRLVWFCFRAECKTRGASDTVRTTDSLKRKLSSRFDDSTPPTWTIPDYFTRVDGSLECIEFLQRNHCWDAYKMHRVKVAYDPKQHRCVFLIRTRTQLVDAVGRALNKADKPKWLRYGSSREPFVCGSGPVAVIVEDAASACAVSPVAVGFALLGTNLMDSHMGYLKEYDRVLIALDKDATKKSLEMHRRLSYLVSCTVVPLDDDLKYAEPEKVKATLNL